MAASVDLRVFATTYSAQFNISIRNALLASPTKSLLDNTSHRCYQPHGRLALTLRDTECLPQTSFKTPRLPPELDVLIMEILSSDLVALQSAALTCRAWLAAARHYLFRYVQLMDDGQMDRLLCAMRSSPVISGCIRAIRIGDRNNSFRGLNTSEFLTKLAELPLPPANLCSLEFYGVYVDFDVKAISKLTRLTSVASLAFSQCSLTPDETCALSSVFPNIVHLKVENCATLFIGTLKSTALPCLHNIALTSLAVNDMNILKEGLESLLEYLLTTRSRHTLRSVKFMIGEAAVQPVGEFLWALGPHLRHLEFGFWLNVDTLVQLCSKALLHIRLCHNTELRELTIHDPTFPLIQGLLVQIKAPKLDQITLLWAPRAFASVGRSLLVGVLAMPQFSKVKRMKFVYDGSYDAETELSMRSAFKEVDEKGILHVSPGK